MGTVPPFFWGGTVEFPIYIYMRWVQVTPGVTLKSYTFFKPLDLSRSNGQKKTIINANILIDLIYYSLFNTFYTYF